MEQSLKNISEGFTLSMLAIVFLNSDYNVVINGIWTCNLSE